MTAHDWNDRRSLMGFRPDQIALAFDRVRDHRDWKAPIRSTIHASEREVVAVAVQWFTGTTAEFVELHDAPGKLSVRAPGQRKGPTAMLDELPRSSRTMVAAASRHPGNVGRGLALDPEA